MSRGGFTLLELMIVMTIIFMVSMGVYAPYKFYQQKTDLKLGAKQIEQFLYTARNSAIYGTASGSNLSFGLLLSDNESDPVQLYSYGFDTDPELLNIGTGDRVDQTKIALQPNIFIHQVSDFNQALFFYEAISGNITVLGINESEKTLIDTDKIDIIVSYKGAESSLLQKTLTYYTQTHILDY